MYDVLKSSINNSHQPSRFKTTTDASSPERNPWLFTDPAASAEYAQQERLDQLRDDILSYVLCDGQWTTEEVELERSLRRLRQAGVLVGKGTASYLSPHPTVYRAVAEGTLDIAGRKYHFDASEDVVFLPWLARTYYPGHTGPVWIGRLRATQSFCLTCEVFPQATQLCECALSLLRRTLPNGATKGSACYS